MYNRKAYDYECSEDQDLAKLEELQKGAQVKGVLPGVLVTVVDVKWHGSDVVELTYKDQTGKPDITLLYRDRESQLEITEAGLPWSFDADGELLRLVSEAYRIRLAYLFDPLLAVHTSLVDPLPHQITAVYGEMLTRQPLRFLLADDPGAGKTIMAGLLVKELLIRGDLNRCLIVCPGSLVEQWQDELNTKFQLPFDIMTGDKLESARTGNWFAETNLVICRLDMLSRSDDLQAKLEHTDWDLIIVDEAHKMAASFFGGEIKYTKRHLLGQKLSKLTRHFLLMSATPHNGKEEDFQLFMSLIDGDRFEGRFRDGVHTADVSDLMRRMVKEQLLKFDGTPLFPERRAYTVGYSLSGLEAQLYADVTEYVREEFNRADALENDGRKGTVGFALTILQRRLASSPEAIYQSLKRRRERLEKRLREEKLVKRGKDEVLTEPKLPTITDDDIEEFDEAPDSEAHEIEDQIVDEATAAKTIAELEVEISLLKRLEDLALQVRRSGKDKKWEELSNLLQNNSEMFDVSGHRRKLVIFTEHKDTLNYLIERIGTLLGKPEAVVTIHGAMGREDRKKAEESFKQDKNVQVLVATDAAGEGINLQRAHLMINYDLPWNPNRLEQRFGRIHRIGQTEVCHLWNLVANETREGDVFLRLLEKIQRETEALGGAVFDVLGKLFQGTELRRLLIEAIRYGDNPEVKARIFSVVDNAADRERLRDLIEEGALAKDSMDASRVQRIRQDLERAEARRLQPHFICSFFLKAFELLGGSIKEREPKRFEISHVPGVIRARDRAIGVGEAVLARYERVTCEKTLISVPGLPLAAFVSPGQPLLESTIDIIRERYSGLLKRGAIFVDPNDWGLKPRGLLYLEHTIQDARIDNKGNRRVVSRQMQFVEISEDGEVSSGGYAPYLDYTPLAKDDRELVLSAVKEKWLGRSLENEAIGFAIGKLVPAHLEEVRSRKDELIKKTRAAVKDRLTKEITYWDNRANYLKEQEEAGKSPKMNSQRARDRADSLQARLDKRLTELEQEGKLSPLPPVVIGGALVIPRGLLAKLKGERAEAGHSFGTGDRDVEIRAMNAAMIYERSKGFEPRDVSHLKCGYDIESLDRSSGRLRFIEVKGRAKGARTVTVTKNEILTALNKPEQTWLALVQVDGDATEVKYVRGVFTKEPDFAVTSVNFDISELLQIGTSE